MIAADARRSLAEILHVEPSEIRSVDRAPDGRWEVELKVDAMVVIPGQRVVVGPNNKLILESALD